MIKWGTWVSLFIGMTLPAHALTGAQLRAADEEYARGYVWGVVESAIFVVSSDDVVGQQLSRKRFDCLSDAKVTDADMFAAVLRRITSEPRFLTASVIQPTLIVLNEMCPSG